MMKKKDKKKAKQEVTMQEIKTVHDVKGFHLLLAFHKGEAWRFKPRDVFNQPAELREMHKYVKKLVNSPRPMTELSAIAKALKNA